MKIIDKKEKSIHRYLHEMYFDFCPSRVQGPRKLLGFEHFKTHFE
jgi:hypothetical protein